MTESNYNAWNRKQTMSRKDHLDHLPAVVVRSNFEAVGAESLQLRSTLGEPKKRSLVRK